MPVVIITGSSSGIGRETAIHFARHGWQVMLTGRNEKNLSEAVSECLRAGAKVTDIAHVVGDINSLSVAKLLVETTVDKFGTINCLVNNAGIVTMGTFAESKLDQYETMFNTNVWSVIQLTQLALPHLIASGGTVVNVSSIASLAWQPGYGFYSMTKSALDAFTKTLAVEVAAQGVRVNSVNPGNINTPIFDSIGMTDEQKAQTFEYAKKAHALGRMGTVDEVAKAIFWLAGPDSSFTTGELLKVDGGFVLVRP